MGSGASLPTVLFAAGVLTALAGCGGAQAVSHTESPSDSTVENLEVEGTPAAHGSSGWRLVYANDEEGQPLEGSKEALIESVRAGQPVRVYVRGRRVEHAADAAFLTIFQGEVFAQIHPIESQAPALDPARVEFRQPGQRWRAIYGTNGQVSALMDGSEPRANRQTVRWFVAP